jgi:hypothetical protein
MADGRFDIKNFLCYKPVITRFDRWFYVFHGHGLIVEEGDQIGIGRRHSGPDCRDSDLKKE